MTEQQPPAAATAGFKLTSKHISGLSITLICAVGGYLAFALWSGWEQVQLALIKVGWTGVVIALGLSLVNYGLRFIRWQGYLHSLGHALDWKPSLQIYVAGFALTTTPAKAGEALRGVLLRSHGVPYSDSFAAFFSERLSDLMAVVVLALLGLALYPQLQGVVWVGVAAVAAGLITLTQRRLVQRFLQVVAQRPQKLYRSLAAVMQMVSQAQRCHGWSQLASASALSLVAWFAEALAFYWVLGWMDVSVSLQFAVFVYAAGMLAGALSFMPGGLGGAEAVMVALLTWAGMPLAEAVAATVLIRLTTLWFAVVLGLYALFKRSNNAGAAHD